LIFEQKTIQTTQQIRDFFYYLSGALILALIAIVRLPVFTSHFTPAEFGVFSLVSITYTYLSVALYNWITSCLYRYFHEYLENRQQTVLFSSIVFLFMVASLILFLVSVCWYFLAGNADLRRLVITAFCFLFTNQVFNMFLVIYKLQGRALNYNLYQVIQAGFSFMLILLLIFRMDQRIEAIFSGQVIMNVLLLGFLTIKNRHMLKMLSPRFVSTAMIRKLMHFGFIGFISSAGIFILISSDRYIIALFEDISRVGIYNQVYQVGQVSVYFLVTVFFNTITPGFNKILTRYSAENEKTLQYYVNAFVLLLLPVTFFVSLFAKQVAEFLLGEAFRQGYAMIPWIVVSSFIYGLTLFNETKMKFEQHFRSVVWGVILACVLNAGLNFILIPLLGYTWAAISTFIAYLFLFVFYYLKDDFAFFGDVQLIRILRIIASVLIVEGFADLLFRNVIGIHVNKWLTLFEAFVFLAIYAWVIFRFKLLRIGYPSPQINKSTDQ
jgi:O-antigen/teichoic acid export membrane protein